jgi:hypothetical protein
VRERLITLVCALGALALFVTMFLRQDTHGLLGKDAPRPTTEERGPNGYHAAMEWLNAEHVRVVSLRDRYDKLARKPLTSAGNVLVVTLPATADFKTEEFRPLDRWVRDGNTLLVLAALSDLPDWAMFVSSITSSDLNLLTGLDFETVQRRDRRLGRTEPKNSNSSGPVQWADAVRAMQTPSVGTLIPNRDHAYFRGVREVRALSDYQPQAWTVRVPYEGFVLALARQRETGEGVFWIRPLGKGRIVVSGLGTVFTNRALGLADNARLLSNIVATDLGPGGTVMFDDVHQGLGAGYDSVKFYRDPRLHVTIGIVALLWLAWVLGGTRLQVPVSRSPAPREVELVRATGGFLARVLTPRAAARRMFELFLRRWPWEVLERQSRVAGADLAQLRQWYSELGYSRVPLIRLHNLIVRIDRQLNS